MEPTNLSPADVSNSGERIGEWDRPELWKSHLDRYRFARRFAGPTSRVLDCVCGSGYGSHLLATRAGSVDGVDLADVAVSFARARYPRPNLRFTTASAYTLPFPDGAFDLGCCFETIEHVPDPRALVAEARRVIAPGGTWIVSTPNRLASGLGPGEKPSNPFHVFEWSLGEMDACLREAFPTIRYFVQRVRSRNKLRPLYVRSKLSRLVGIPDVVELGGADVWAERLETAEAWMPEILIAVCGDQKGPVDS